jgi:glucose/arabinose dehydrogenase
MPGAVRRPSRPAFAVLIALVLSGGAGPAVAAVPSGFTDTLVAGGLSSPTAMAVAPDGRIFVAEQGGRLRVIQGGTLLSTPFVTVPVDSQGERGLLGVTFDPAFTTNQFVYVYYTATTPNVHNRLSRFTADGNVAVTGSERVLLELDPLSGATNHNGGAIHFGRDGKLYVAVGDNANGNNSQSLTNLLGKMLRLSSDGTIPADNPFAGSTTGKNKAIWAIGLRNPFTFSFHRGTGRMFINDVGAATWEEINDGIAGSNYGWPETEGPTTDPRFRSPVHAYTHAATGGCAITGGAFYDAATPSFPSEFVNTYLYADFCAGFIRRFKPASASGPASDTGFATGLSMPVDLALAADGSLYYLARGSGAVRRIAFTGSGAPVISTHPADQTVTEGQRATFSVVATGTPPLSYQWQRNGTDIAGATAASYTTPPTAPADNGAQFRVRVSNSAGSVLSNPATLTVTANRAPTGTITAPTSGTTYAAGTTVSYAGTATDPEDGTLPPSAFTWRVDFHHADHVHPFVPPTSGSQTGSFTIPDTGETATDVWYRVILTVRDSGGLTHTSFRDLQPRVVTLRVETSPSGLRVSLDGQPRPAPYTFTSVVGMRRTLTATSPQTSFTGTWVFSSWSDGGTASHQIVTPSAATTYRATFARS